MNALVEAIYSVSAFTLASVASILIYGPNWRGGHRRRWCGHLARRQGGRDEKEEFVSRLAGFVKSFWSRKAFDTLLLVAGVILIAKGESGDDLVATLIGGGMLGMFASAAVER